MSIAREFLGSRRQGFAVARFDPDRLPVDSDAEVDVLCAGSIDAFEPGEWDALFDDELENWHYLRALERAAGWRPLYFTIRSRGRAIAGVSAYLASRLPRAAWHDRLVDADATAVNRPPVLVLGSPFALACRIGCAHEARPRRAELTAALIRAAQARTVACNLGGLVVETLDGSDSESVISACRDLCLERVVTTPIAHLALPTWSFADYLIGLDAPHRLRLWDACERAGDYTFCWSADVARDADSIVELCADIGLTALDVECFKALLASSMVGASCLHAWAGTQLVGFSLVLHGARRLREGLVAVRGSADRELVSSLMWLETLRFCLDRGIRTYESSNPEAIAAAQPHEVFRRARWEPIASSR